MEPRLTPTGRVICGMIAFGKRTGYDIKQFVDKSTRHFWAASYGQIYPELKRLEDQGMVTGRQEPTGGRARTVYDLTDAGRSALNEWLSSDEPPLYELRDEGMLKLFFSDLLPERRIENLRAMREVQRRKLEALRTFEPKARENAPKGAYMTLQFGLAFTEFLINWSEETERRLAAEIETDKE